jgi:putative SOS response-associated peptidase YedK
MPVIIGKEIETDWLSEKTCPADLIDHLLKGSHEPDIYVDSVSNYVNSTKHSGKECIALRPRLI